MNAIPSQPTDIDVSKISSAWIVTWKGHKVLDLNKQTNSKAKLVALRLEELINRDGKRCRRCGREEWLTVDHVVPVSILRDMGVPEVETYEDPENLVLLCKPCNSFKANRLDFSDPRTKRVLMRLLEKL